MEMVQLLADKCALLGRNVFGETIFHMACKLKMTRILDFVFEKVRYPPKLKNSFGQTLLHIACHMSDLELVKYLANQKKYSMKDDINVLEDTSDLTPLQYACVKSKTSLFEYLIGINGCDPDTKNKEGYTAFHICCQKNLKSMVKLCCKHCSLTVRNSSGDTPLHLACAKGNHDLALELMHNVRAKNLDSYVNNSGYTVLHVAAKQKGAGEVLKCIVEMGICSATVKTNEREETALHLACVEGISENALYLFTLTYDEGSQFTKYNESPLYLAYCHYKFDFFMSIMAAVPLWQLKRCANVHIERVKFHPHKFVAEFPFFQCFLTTHGSSCSGDMCQRIKDVSVCLLNLFPSVISMLDSHGCSLLHYLAYFGCEVMEEVVDRVIQLCEDKIDQFDDSQRLPLHIACLRKNEFMIYKLLSHEGGSNQLSHKDNQDKTPSDLYGKLSNEKSWPGSFLFLAAHGADVTTVSREVEQNKLKGTPSINIIVVGNSANGKTTLIQTLKSMLMDSSEKLASIRRPTTGIVADEILTTSKHCYKFFDFAGHVEFETAHSIRLESLLSLAAESPSSSPFIFLILVKGTDTFEDNKKQIDKWFSFVHNHLRSANRQINIAFVCSHDDCLCEKEKRKEEIAEYVGSLDQRALHFSIEFYPKPILLDCRESDSFPINVLLRYFNDVCLSCKFLPPNLACIELKERLDVWFEAPCQVKDLIEKIKECRQFKFANKKIEVSGSDPKILIPFEPNKLVELLSQLHLQNDIVLLTSSSLNQLSWWIIKKSVQDVLFSEVSCIFSPEEFENAPNLSWTHNTGVIPSSMLSEIFKSLSLDIELIENYLLCMGYCKIIEDKEVLNLITGDQGTENCRYFFFPGLIRGTKQGLIIPKPDSEGGFYSCAWVLESQQDLGLRFLHSLLLSLTFKFSHDSDSRFNKKLCLWKTGLFWCTRSGVNVLVEVEQDTRVVALFQCESETLSKVLLAKLRSEVMAEIRDVLARSVVGDREVNTSEYFLHPPPKDFNGFNDSISSHRILTNRVKRTMEEECHCRSLHISDTETVKLSTLLGFDSYVPLKTSTLRLLMGKDSEAATLKTCFDGLRRYGTDVLELILDLSVSDNIHHEWMLEHASEPVQELRSKLDNYSIFQLSDLL